MEASTYASAPMSSALPPAPLTPQTWTNCWTAISALISRNKCKLMGELQAELVELTQMRQGARHYGDMDGEKALVEYYDREVNKLLERLRNQQVAGIEKLLRKLHANFEPYAHESDRKYVWLWLKKWLESLTSSTDRCFERHLDDWRDSSVRAMRYGWFAVEYK